MTTLDLSDYDAAVQEALSAPIVPEPFFACLIAAIIIAWAVGIVLVGASANMNKLDDSRRFDHLGGFSYSSPRCPPSACFCAAY